MEIWINSLVNIIVSLAIIIGTFFVLSSSIGMIRFPDVYTRLHAATKASTLGVMSLILGAFIYLYFAHDIISGKLILATFFIILTNPVAGHMLSRAAHSAGVEPVRHNRIDAYEESLHKK